MQLSPKVKETSNRLGRRALEMSYRDESATINVSMPPRQPHQYGQPTPQPQQPTGPPPGQHAPQYGYGQSDSQHYHPVSNGFQQNQHGQYEVLPALQASPNDGHSGHNPYEFIVNPNLQKTSMFNFSLAGGNVGIKLAALLGVVLLVVVIAAVAMSALAPKGDTVSLESIAERQQEMIRVTNNAIQQQQAQSQDAQNFVTNVNASMTYSQQQVLNSLSAHGTKLGTKTLAIDDHPQTDSSLATAASANNFDDAVAQYLVSQLQSYQGLLQTTFGQTSNVTTKRLLQQDYNGASLLIKQGTELEKELQG